METVMPTSGRFEKLFIVSTVRVYWAHLQKLSGKLLIFFNTALGIWFLSTLTLGGWAHFQQCVHDADQMKEDYYKLVHELRVRRANVALKLVNNETLSAADMKHSADPEYRETSYMVVYWKLREVLDHIQFTKKEKVTERIQGYMTDPYMELFTQAEYMEKPPIDDKVEKFSKNVPEDDINGVRLSGPLKRSCGPIQVGSSLIGRTPRFLYVDPAPAPTTLGGPGGEAGR
jgi:hypothetical protein